MKDFQILKIGELGSKGNINLFEVTYIYAINESISYRFCPQFKDKEEYLLFREKFNNWDEHFISIREKAKGIYSFITRNGEKEINILRDLKEYVLTNM